jgi:hypothetical protein
MTIAEMKSKIAGLNLRLANTKLPVAERYEIDAEINYLKDELADAGEVVEGFDAIKPDVSINGGVLTLS